MIADNLAHAHDELANLGDIRTEGGGWTRVGPIVCARLPVEQPWGIQARTARAVPSAQDMDRAVAWMEQYGPRWTVSTRAEFASAPVFRGLEQWLTLPAYLLAGPVPTDAAPSGFTVEPALDSRAFAGVWGPESAVLYREAYLSSPSYRHLVGRYDGESVACARIRVVAGTAYLSGIGVRPDHRGRGLGLAISAAATRLATELSDTVWLQAVPDVARLYQRIGYRRVDTYVSLALPGTTPG